MKIYSIPLLCVFSINALAVELPAASPAENSEDTIVAAVKDDSIERGAELHQSHCVACHENMTEGDASSLYTREDRNVTTLSGLQNQVQRCVTNLKLDWFDDEIHDVSNYLNAQYYHY